MNVRQISSSRRLPIASETNKRGAKRRFFSLIVLVLSFVAIFSIGHLRAHATNKGDTIKSGYQGYCLDNYRSGDKPGNTVDIWGCNGSDAQSWDISLTQIRMTNNLCVEASSITQIILDNCSQSPKQIWLEDGSELYSPHFQRCLTAQGASDGSPLTLESCHQSGLLGQNFVPSVNLKDTPCTGTQGQVVACTAVKEWINWQANPSQRLSYLNNYTDQAPWEEWCADFVSYVYKEAGYPFSNGDPGWDENIAADVVDQGFDVHQAGSYIPQPGDVGYFSYPGGHVEIVIAGGPNPTFIYGDSETKDPIINNGAMASNDLLSEKGLGSIQYYMSPNSST